MSRRRAKGEGSIEQLPNGKWKARTSFVDASGKRHQPTAIRDTKREILA